MSLSPLKVPRVRQRTGSGFAGYDTLQICSPLCRCQILRTIKRLFYGGLNVSYLISIVIKHQKGCFYEEFVFDKRCATMIVKYFLKKQNAI